MRHFGEKFFRAISSFSRQSAVYINITITRKYITQNTQKNNNTSKVALFKIQLCNI